jgi:cell division protein FtsA
MDMNKENIAVGLDIGTTKIVAIIGRKNEYGKIEVLGFGKAKSLGVSRGVVNNITQTIASIKQAVTMAEEAAGVQISNVVAGIAGQHIRSIQHTDYIVRNNLEDVIEESDIDSLVDQVRKLTLLAGEEILHILPQEFLIDGTSESKEPIGMAGLRLEAKFHVVVGQASSIRNVGRCIKEAGLNLADLTLEPLASADAVLSNDEKEAGVALIDIGGGTTDLAIFKDGIIRHTAVIPFGGNSITEDIKEGCSIIEKQAEALKIKFGSAWPSNNRENEIVAIPSFRGQDPKEISLRNLSLIINARVLEIIEFVFDEIKAYGYDEQRKKLIAGIVLTGGGAELKDIKLLVEYVTGLDTRIGYPQEHLAEDAPDLIKGSTGPTYATAVGLLMKGLENNNISYRKAKALEEKQYKTTLQNQVEEPSPVIESTVELEEATDIETIENNQQGGEKIVEKPKRSFINNIVDRFKEFIDNVD